jgi:hypothetical protein
MAQIDVPVAHTEEIDGVDSSAEEEGDEPPPPPAGTISARHFSAGGGSTPDRWDGSTLGSKILQITNARVP